MRPQHRDLAGVRIRRARFSERVVAVVPDDDKAEIGDRREHGTAGADHQARVAAQRGQPAAVPFGRPQTRGQRDHRRSVDEPHGVREQSVDVALVGHHGQRAAPGADDHCHGFGQAGGPLLTRQCLPHRARGAALGQRGHEPLAALVHAPIRDVNRRRRTGNLGRPHLALDTGVARRHREPQHVRPGAGVSGRDRVDQAPHVGRQHRLGRHHPVEPAELADMVGVRPSFQHERIDQAAVETHACPNAGLSVVGLIGRDEVIEFAVQVRHRQHRQHASDGLVLGGPAAGAHSSGVSAGSDVSVCGSVAPLVGNCLPKKNPAVISS
jgi:hypothetical protein